MSKLSRRGILKGIVAGAVVLGFDPLGRSWVTEARANTPFSHVPPLDGTLATDPASLAAAADDWGHIVHFTPVAVLSPGSVEDVVKMVNFARTYGIKITGRGQAHTPLGQSQIEAGIVFDMSSLDQIHSIDACGGAVVDAGVIWRDLVLATTAVGLTPPVLTDYLMLTVGGTLSVGGVSGTSFHHGAQVDNVTELQVVTGRGELLVCSPYQRPDLFDAALGGLGLCAIIVRATIQLIPAKQRALSYQLFYPDVPSLLADLRTIIHHNRFDYTEGVALPGPTGLSFYITAAKFYTPGDTNNNLLQGLNPIAGQTVTTDTTYFEFVDQVDQLIAYLGSLGLNALPHPWVDLFVPGSVAEAFTSQTIAGLDYSVFEPGSLILFYGFKRHLFGQPAVRVPNEEIFFLFDILRTVAPDPTIVSTVLAENRALYDQNVAQGGTEYTISALALSPADWKVHFGWFWPALAVAKAIHDPQNLLGTGLNVFG